MGAFRFLLAVLSSGVNAGVWLDSQTAESVATGMASVFVAGFDKDDMSHNVLELETNVQTKVRNHGEGPY